jgi:hypothetical protein
MCYKINEIDLSMKYNEIVFLLIDGVWVCIYMNTHMYICAYRHMYK